MPHASHPPPGLIPVTLAKGCVLLLTQAEHLAATRRGKRWRRQAAMDRRAVAERGEHA